MIRPLLLVSVVSFVAALGSPAWALKDVAKITLVQLTTRGKSPESVIERMPAFFDQAAQYGSDLIVFPEYVLGHMITVDHPRVQKFFQLAREHNMYAIAGMVEKCGDRWATTALVVDRQGNLLGRYFKCHPASGAPPHFWPPVKGSDAEARAVGQPVQGVSSRLRADRDS